MTPASPEPAPAGRPARAGGKRTALVLSTVGWFALACGLVGWAFASGFCLDDQTCRQLDDEGLTRDQEWQIVLVAVLVSLAVLALLPFALGMPKTGAVYAALALAFTVWLSQQDFAREIARDLLRDDAPAQEHEVDPGQCIPRSGGDSECPGG
ncbi:hypothetical protein [Glycomyces terrestris]|uniref:Uncharacterized protein n=1 Tax=Glycomyces terrestris TaxID=2493553 RepID=A0A426URN7_9ACTN|nr:hypothetical protein [Glycomyces terrestris]RRR95830.1 hypothetical protein EIW28_23360 [Glycomyces terrestris]